MKPKLWSKRHITITLPCSCITAKIILNLLQQLYLRNFIALVIFDFQWYNLTV